MGKDSRVCSSTTEDFPETIPSLFKFIAGNEVAGFDNVKVSNDLKDQHEPAAFHPFTPSAMEIEEAPAERMRSVSISMPSSPLEARTPDMRRVFFTENHDETSLSSNAQSTLGSSKCSNPPKPKQAKFYSQPMPTGAAELPPRHTRIDKLKDKRFDSFKTWSGKLERQLSTLRGKRRNTADDESDSQPKPEMETVPVDRYFDALEGPELDTLRASEEILLPDDKTWPFLLRFPVSSFGICLGISSQAIMWKALATSASTEFLHISLDVNLVLWCISIVLIAIVALIYALKVIFYFEAVRREYYHPIRVNFFFAPWIALLFSAIGAPPSVSKNLHTALWYVLMAPILFLELKIYGQWMSGGQRRLSKVANPSNHLSVVGNFVGALLGASMGLKEGPIFFFAVGLAHYIVLFVTLYQRLPTNETLPKELHPVFFLFVAAPSVASMAWANIQGSFDFGSRIAYFIALFLYFSLAVRINFFRGFRFSLAWWAYTFPMTGAAIATIRYSNVVSNTFTKSLAVILSVVATLIVAGLLITTIIHAFVLRDLFPNDIAIAISETNPKRPRKWYHRRNGSSDAKDTEHYLKNLHSDGSRDIEAGLAVPPSSTSQENSSSGKKEVHINNASSCPPS